MRALLVAALVLGCRGKRPDLDGDGHIDAAYGGDDCDDGDAGVFPGAPDALCDGVDQDCDGFDADDGDSDGHGCATDCDDGDAARFPGAPEAAYDGIDQDCDGYDLVDVDEDGHAWDGLGGTDCDDDDALIHPDAVEVPYDGIDQDCDGVDLVDVDEDGWIASEVGGWDCDDTNPDVHPGAPDPIGDGIDWNCDGHDPEPPVVGACGETSAPMGTLGEADMGAVFRTEYVDGEWAALGMGRDAVGGFDANGDGYSDVAVAAPGASVAVGTDLVEFAGAVYILYGPRCGPHDPLAYDAVIRGVGERYAFGGRMAPVGDLDGDGWDDLAISAPGELEGLFVDHWKKRLDSPDHGRVVFGPLAGEVPLDETHTLTLETAAVEMYGTYDHTGDGVRDLIAGGLVYAAPVLRGSLANSDARTQILYDGDASVYPYLPMPIKDTDGDGAADLVVQGGVMSGPTPSGILSTSDADQLLVGAQPNERYEWPSELGDIDGDGRGDLAFNARSMAKPLMYVVGLAGPRLSILDSLFRGDERFYALNPQNRPFDLDSDGIDDLVVAPGAPEASVMAWYGPVGGTLEPKDADFQVVAPVYDAGAWPRSVGYAGDYDADGYEDLFVGWSTENGRLTASEAWLLLGGPRH